MSALTRWIRWRIAYALDRRPNWCWADLVSWALYGDRPLQDCRVSHRCEPGEDGRCYCGKLP